MTHKENYEQISLFEEEVEGKKNLSNDTFSNGKLPVVCAKMENDLLISWEELFEGFDEIYIITYSSGIDFANKLIDKFKYSEIVFGYDGIVGTGFHAIMAVETNIIKKIVNKRSAEELSKKINEGALNIYISRDIKSHEKIYCLKSSDGRKRVITGSANLSASAFSGVQRENIICYDDEKAFNYYYTLYKDFRDECSDSVDAFALKAALKKEDEFGKDIEDVPIVKTIEKQSVVFLTPAEQPSIEEIQFTTSTSELSKELKKILPLPRKENGRIVLTTKDVISAKNKTKNLIEKKIAEKKVFPKLHLDFDKEMLSMNGVPITLTPDSKSVKSDIKNFLDYLDSLKVFSNDYKKTQRNYYLFANWEFSSIFIPYLRNVASRNDYSVLQFPTAGILYGDQNGGKSAFCRLMNRLISGENIQLCHSADFTYSYVDKLKQACEGVPICFDDLAKTQYSAHYEKIFKNDFWGIPQGLQNYSPLVISTNKLKAVSQDISKRVIICKIDAVISNETGTKASKRINDIINSCGNAFFREYVSLMLPKIHSMVEKMKVGDPNFIPDVLKELAETLFFLFKKYGFNTSEYMENIDYFTYFGDRARGENAVQKLRQAYMSEPENFKIDKTKGILIYKFPDSAYYSVKYTADELPPELTPKLAATTLTMNLEAARDIFGFKFKKTLFGRHE